MEATDALHLSPLTKDFFVTVCVDRGVTSAAVRSAVETLRQPQTISLVTVDDSAVSDMLGCRVAIYLAGSFHSAFVARSIARGYAAALSMVLRAPVHSLSDLLQRDGSA